LVGSPSDHFWRQKHSEFFFISNLYSLSNHPVEATKEVFAKLKGFSFLHTKPFSLQKSFKHFFLFFAEIILSLNKAITLVLFWGEVAIVFVYVKALIRVIILFKRFDVQRLLVCSPINRFFGCLS